MKDYLFIIKTEGSVWNDLSKNQLDHHLKNGQDYLDKLIKNGQLKNANPIEPLGSKIVTEHNGSLNVAGYNEGKTIIAGYFHISAPNIEIAVEAAKQNPIFEDIPTSIEIHPMMPIGGN